MKLLLHTCCAPCSISPVQFLREQNLDVMGYFYRNNIHPYTECLKRQETLESYAKKIDLRVIYQEGYDLNGFIRNVVFRESNRCSYCYHERLRATALLAKHGKFDYFSTTLLYSKFQKHDTIRSIGESVSSGVG
ncbi:MAG: epoxyqueuosine reductase QueH, partial [Desulfobacterales bacterium]|nr:epoxyqueuosine reductase QueH [Desulfobacterales bacterium]